MYTLLVWVLTGMSCSISDMMLIPTHKFTISSEQDYELQHWLANIDFYRKDDNNNDKDSKKNKSRGYCTVLTYAIGYYLVNFQSNPVTDQRWHDAVIQQLVFVQPMFVQLGLIKYIWEAIHFKILSGFNETSNLLTGTVQKPYKKHEIRRKESEEKQALSVLKLSR